MSENLANLTPEEKLLLSLCRLDFTEPQKARISTLIKQVTNWDRFVWLANEHGIIALCWHNLVELHTDATIPKDYLEHLHKGYLASLARNTRIFNLLEQVLKIAKKENIEIILIKGLALEKTIYGNQGLRQMNDLDILVKSKHAIQLRKLLLQNGFQSQPVISPLHEKIIPSYGKHLPEMYKEGLSVEIHFKLFEQKGNSLTETFIEKSLLIKNSDNFNIPDPLMHFLYLIKHLQKHESEGTTQLRLYTDLAVLILSQMDNFLKTDLYESAVQVGIEKALSEKLLFLNEYWGIGLSSIDLNIPEPSEKDKVIEKFICLLRYPKDLKNNENPESLLKPMKEMEKFSQKLLFIIGYIFPSITFMKYRYNAHPIAKAIMYYPVRWAKLIKLVFSGSL